MPQVAITEVNGKMMICVGFERAELLGMASGEKPLQTNLIAPTMLLAIMTLDDGGDLPEAVMRGLQSVAGDMQLKFEVIREHEGT